MKAFNKRRKPKHAMKIGHNEDYIFEVNYFGYIFSTKKHSTTKTFMFGVRNKHTVYKFDFKKAKTIYRM